MTDVLTLFDAPWARGAAALLIVAGTALLWHGLIGERNGERGLLRRRIDMLSRMEGFRRVVFGLVLMGVGGAVIWQSEWLLWMALGIGFVEILESSTLIAVWKRSSGRTMRKASSFREV